MSISVAGFNLSTNPADTLVAVSNTANPDLLAIETTDVPVSTDLTFQGYTTTEFALQLFGSFGYTLGAPLPDPFDAAGVVLGSGPTTPSSIAIVFDDLNNSTDYFMVGNLTQISATPGPRGLGWSLALALLGFSALHHRFKLLKRPASKQLTTHEER